MRDKLPLQHLNGPVIYVIPKLNMDDFSILAGPLWYVDNTKNGDY